MWTPVTVTHEQQSTAGPDLMKLAAVTACYQSRGDFFKVNFCQFVCSIVLQCNKSFKK